MNQHYQDPHFPWIWGFFSTGILCTALSIPGYLHQTEVIAIEAIELNYPAPVRKVPFSLLGAGFSVLAWWEVKNREEWQQQNERDRLHALQLAEIEQQAAIEAFRYQSQLQAAERAYGQLEAYLNQPQPVTIQVAATPTSHDVLPVRDLTAEIAQYDGHILIASRTRSGKTTTVQSAIRHTHGRHNGNVDFHLFDPKGAAWCGLENDGDRYLFCNKPEYIPAVLERLELLVEAMQDRQHTRMQQGGHYRSGIEPRIRIVAIDEFNTLLSLAQEYDESFPPKQNPRTQKKIQRYVERFIFQGAEDKVYLWLMAQTTRVEQLGLNTSVQDNMAYFAQSRNGDYQSVEDAISNNYVVSSATQRKELQALLTSYRYDNNQALQIPIAFTTLGGNQLCKLPDLSQAKHHQIQSATSVYQQPVTPNPPAQPRSRDIRQHLEFMLQQSPDFDFGSGREVALPPLHQKLLSYGQRKGGWLKLRDTKKNWGDNNDVPYAQVEQMVRELVGWELAVLSEDGTQWQPK